MSRPATHLHLAHVTLEARTPISSASGGSETLHNMALARDANGLPRLAGASIQGVLRAIWEADGRGAAPFGFQWEDEGEAARLTVSDAIVHGKDDACALAPPRAPDPDDEILALLAADAPLTRDHVRLNDRGVVDGDGKFERVAVPIGTRFSLELALWGDAGDGETLKAIVDQTADPRFRLGGAALRGYGAVRARRAALWSGALTTTSAADVRTARRAPFSAPAAPPFRKYEPRRSAAAGSRVQTLSLQLAPIGLWRVGAGPRDASSTVGATPPRPNGAERRERTPDARPLREPRIAWDGGVTGKIVEAKDAAYLVPGASLKGALAHRTLFHWNRLNGLWAKDATSVCEHARRPEELMDLFGAEHSGAGDNEEGRASRLLVDDALVEGKAEALALDHVSIDRFTGGARSGALFSEEALIGGEIKAQLTLLPRLDGTVHAPFAIGALNAAIADLCQGRLALGANSLGFCRSRGAPPAFMAAAGGGVVG